MAAATIEVVIPYVPPSAEAFRATALDMVDWLVTVVAFIPAAAAGLVRT